MKNLQFIHRLNQKSAPVRTAVPSGHDPYEKASSGRGDDVRWQLKPCPEPDSYQLAAILENARLKRLELDAIELDVDRLKRKRRTVGKSGVPPEAA
jgi:hypothetical protein